MFSSCPPICYYFLFFSFSLSSYCNFLLSASLFCPGLFSLILAQLLWILPTTPLPLPPLHMILFFTSLKLCFLLLYPPPTSFYPLFSSTLIEYCLLFFYLLYYCPLPLLPHLCFCFSLSTFNFLYSLPDTVTFRSLSCFLPFTFFSFGTSHLLLPLLQFLSLSLPFLHPHTLPLTSNSFHFKTTFANIFSCHSDFLHCSLSPPILASLHPFPLLSFLHASSPSYLTAISPPPTITWRCPQSILLSLFFSPSPYSPSKCALPLVPTLPSSNCLSLLIPLNIQYHLLSNKEALPYLQSECETKLGRERILDDTQTVCVCVYTCILISSRLLFSFKWRHSPHRDLALLQLTLTSYRAPSSYPLLLLNLPLLFLPQQKGDVTFSEALSFPLLSFFSCFFSPPSFH